MESWMVRLKDIAEKAGVSQMTVSRIINGKASGCVSAEVLKRVKNAIERLGYQKRTGSRHFKQRNDVPVQKKIFFLIPFPEFLEKDLPEPQTRVMTQSLEGALQAAMKFGATVETLPFSRSNSAIDISWELLAHLGAGDNVLSVSEWDMIPVMELLRRGCRIAHVARDFFWRTLYAPQLKNCACFTLNVRNGFVKLTNFLLEHDARKVAIIVHSKYMHEPDYPRTGGYEQALSLAGNSYRHFIPLDEEVKDWPGKIAEAYRKSPFDGLIFSQFSEYGNFDPKKTFQKNMGLPDTVQIVLTGRSDTPSFWRMQFPALVAPQKQMAYDAVKLLLSNDFSNGERFYECDFDSK